MLHLLLQYRSAKTDIPIPYPNKSKSAQEFGLQFQCRQLDLNMSQWRIHNFPDGEGGCVSEKNACDPHQSQYLDDHERFFIAIQITWIVGKHLSFQSILGVWMVTEGFLTTIQLYCKYLHRVWMGTKVFCTTLCELMRNTSVSGFTRRQN